MRQQQKHARRTEGTDPASQTSLEEDVFGGWPAPLARWKSRLPLIVVPLLTGMRHLPKEAVSLSSTFGSALPLVEAALLWTIALATGYSHMPFSVTWWLILLSSLGLESPLLLGAATVSSLSLLLGWYGVRMKWPTAIEVLWGGSRLKGGVAKGSWHRVCWQVWDLFVHLLPATMILYWHGPWLDEHGLHHGAVTKGALLAALPLNLLWLLAASASPHKTKHEAAEAEHETIEEEKVRFRPGFASLWRLLEASLAKTNLVYQVEAIPDHAWLWIYGSHWAVCCTWLATFVLPREVVFVYLVIGLNGLFWRPYTEAFWILFVSAGVLLPQWTFLRGMVACMAVPLAMGFYGPQLFYPELFGSLVDGWFIQPFARLLPGHRAKWFQGFILKKRFWFIARMVDSCVHALPALVAVSLFQQHVTSKVALIALPTNIWWLAATGAKCCADTNRIYGIQPDMPKHAWTLVHGSHWLYCSVWGLALSWHGA